jgi:hypothetical protein
MATTTATATASASAETAALGALLGFVHTQSAAIKRCTVHCFDGLLSLCRGAHRDKSEAARLTRRTVGHDVDVGNLTDACECLTHGVDRGRKGKVADVKTRSHDFSSLARGSITPPVEALVCQCLPSNRPRDQQQDRSGEIRYVHTLP